MVVQIFENLGQSSPFQGNVEQGVDTQTVINVGGSDIINLPSADFVNNADITRSGQNLILELSDGSQITIEGYFTADPAPSLTAPNGETLTPKLIAAFARSPSEFAQGNTLSDVSPIGSIEDLSGEAAVIRTDGTVDSVTLGTPIYPGDIVETQGEGAVKISFIDESSLSISENARMAIDEFIFDPASESGKTDVSILRGIFMFTSGLIGRDDPDDVEINTPQGSIGIRGTTIAGNADTGEVTVLEGAIVLRGFDGSEITLADQFETATLNGSTGSVEYQGVLDAQDFSQKFESVRDMSAAVFNSIDGGSSEKPDTSQPQEDSQPDDPTREVQESQTEPNEHSNAGEESTGSETGDAVLPDFGPDFSNELTGRGPVAGDADNNGERAIGDSLRARGQFFLNNREPEQEIGAEPPPADDGGPDIDLPKRGDNLPPTSGGGNGDEEGLVTLTRTGNDSVNGFIFSDEVNDLSNVDVLDIDGKGGHDTIYIESDNVDFSNLNILVNSVEEINVNGAFGTPQTVTLTLEQIFSMMESSGNGVLEITTENTRPDGIVGDQNYTKLSLDSNLESSSVMLTAEELGTHLNNYVHGNGGSTGNNGVSHSTDNSSGYETFSYDGNTLKIESIIFGTNGGGGVEVI